MSPTPTIHDSDSVARLRVATAALREIQASVPLDDRVPEREMRGLRGFSYVSSAAMHVALDVIGEHANDLPLTDAEALASRIAYIDAMTAFADAARELAKRAERSALKQRGEAGRDVVAMYASLKAMAKYSARARPALLRMREVLPRKKPRERGPSSVGAPVASG